MSTDIERFGKDLREFRFHVDLKEILCPYWERTDYGTVRCHFLDVEVLDDEDDDAREKIAAEFGSAEAVDRFGRSWELSDEIKICGIREDEEDAAETFV